MKFGVSSEVFTHIVSVLLYCSSYTLFSLEQEQGHGDVPTFYTYEEGLSHLTSEGQATLDRLEGMLAQSVAQQYHMAGVRTDEPSTAFEGLCVLKLIMHMIYFIREGSLLY